MTMNLSNDEIFHVIFYDKKKKDYITVSYPGGEYIVRGKTKAESLQKMKDVYDSIHWIQTTMKYSSSILNKEDIN